MADGENGDCVKNAKSFCENEVYPRIKHFDACGEVPRDLIRALAQYGLCAPTISRDLGGSGTSQLEYGLITAEFGKAYGPIRDILTVNSSLVAESIDQWGTPPQKENYLLPICRGERLGAFALSEKSSGSDASNMVTEYKVIGKRVIINGSKKWITYGAISDFFLTFAQNMGRVTAFLIDANLPGVTVTKEKRMLANSQSQIAEIDFRNVELSQEQILGNEGMGFSLVANHALNNARYSIAWGALGISEACVEAMIKHSKNRKLFNSSLANLQLTKAKIASSISLLRASESLNRRSAGLREKDCLSAINETCIAKYFSTKSASRISQEAVQLHGAYGCHPDLPIERYFREAKVLEIIEGSSEVLEVLIADHAMRRAKNIQS